MTDKEKRRAEIIRSRKLGAAKLYEGVIPRHFPISEGSTGEDMKISDEAIEEVGRVAAARDLRRKREDMTCKHHPDYKPESGEPTETYYTDDDNKMVQCSPGEPCPYCLQARCEWLGECFVRAELRTREAEKRIKELEAFIVGEARAGDDTAIGRIREAKEDG